VPAQAQTPALQVLPVPPHKCPQEPQLFGSACKSTQREPQPERPASQTSASGALFDEVASEASPAEDAASIAGSLLAPTSGVVVTVAASGTWTIEASVVGSPSESARLGMLLLQLAKTSAGAIKSAVAPIARMNRYFPMGEIVAGCRRRVQHDSRRPTTARPVGFGLSRHGGTGVR
jgi:hypothetical protein